MLKPLLGPCDSFQLEPFAYPWAWEMSRAQENNNWAPEEIAVGPDVLDYKNPALDPKHKHLFESVMAQLTTFDILRGDEIAECLQPIFQPAEIKHFLKRMAWDEALHCYEEGTEVLTSEGWVDFRDLSDAAIVAQVSMEGELSFTKHCGINHCLKDGPILGYSAPEHVATAQYFANLRLGSVGLAAPFPDAYHSFPWMSEQMELKKEKNFFETRVTEYQASGALSFDDEHPHHGQPGWSDPFMGTR